MLGVAAGFLVYLAAAATGLAAVFVAVPTAYTAYTALKILGAAYLFYLAWQAIKPGGNTPLSPREMPVEQPSKLFLMGLFTNLLNPKIAVLYVSLLPQLIDPSAGSIAMQSATLGLIQISIALTVNVMIVLFAGVLASFLSTRPLWARVQRYLMGTVLGLLALHLATDRGRTA